MLAAAVEGMQRVEGVAVEVVRLHDYQFGPCTSCFSCIRDENHLCVQHDAFGDQGMGELFVKVTLANGLFLADAVHHWGPTAMCHLFIERLYPFLWSGKLDGLPFASVSCATNQGMQRLANAEICKWAFAYGMRYVGGLPAHAAYWDRAVAEAQALGQRLAEASVADERDGRRPHGGDEPRWRAYRGQPWEVLEPYLDNMTNGTFTLENSLPATALREGAFHRPEAVALLEQVVPELERALTAYHAGDEETSIHHLVQASAFWTHATWKEFLEEQAVHASAPEVYRPLPGG
jgi:multimeric flavodoxin WrbA